MLIRTENLLNRLAGDTLKKKYYNCLGGTWKIVKIYSKAHFSYPNRLVAVRKAKSEQ